MEAFEIPSIKTPPVMEEGFGEVKTRGFQRPLIGIYCMLGIALAIPCQIPFLLNSPFSLWKGNRVCLL
jgi:hypothetical protein